MSQDFLESVFLTLEEKDRELEGILLLLTETTWYKEKNHWDIDVYNVAFLPEEKIPRIVFSTTIKLDQEWDEENKEVRKKLIDHLSSCQSPKWRSLLYDICKSDYVPSFIKRTIFKMKYLKGNLKVCNKEGEIQRSFSMHGHVIYLTCTQTESVRVNAEQRTGPEMIRFIFDKHRELRKSRKMSFYHEIEYATHDEGNNIVTFFYFVV